MDIAFPLHFDPRGRTASAAAEVRQLIQASAGEVGAGVQRIREVDQLLGEAVVLFFAAVAPIDGGGLGQLGDFLDQFADFVVALPANRETVITVAVAADRSCQRAEQRKIASQLTVQKNDGSWGHYRNHNYRNHPVGLEFMT